MNRTLVLCGSLAALLLSSSAHASGGLVPWPAPSRGLTLAPPPLISEESWRDIYVVPQRPGQNRVAYWDYEWHTHEFAPERGGGGVRLYFYERERPAAAYAISALGEAYERLTDLFHYLPRSTIPFILYASSSEFLATNVFFVSEGTLGATDPRDLRVSMPFFGNVKQFSRVATHELTHEFMLQKLRDRSLGARVENPLVAVPLWFIEGLAEYGTFGGMDPEGDYILRDLVTNPDPMRGYALPDFFNDRAGGYIGVYKLGQARLTFLSDTYGHAKVVELLERTPELAGGIEAVEHGGPRSGDDGEGLPPEATPKKSEVPPAPPPTNFPAFVARVVGESVPKIEERYQEWMKKRYYSAWLSSKQTVASFVQYRGLDGEPDSFSLSDDGKQLVYRTVQRETGQSVLYVQDLRDPASRRTVARDQVPGTESLHPVDRRVTSLRANTLVFAARHGRSDRIYVQRITSRERLEKGRVKVRLSLSDAESFALGELLEVYDPALSPDGKQLALVGIDPSGFRDLYRMDLEGPKKGQLERLTRDEWSESDVFWDGGRLLYVSDRSESHEFNLYAMDMQSRVAARLTWSEKEERHPVPALGGVLFRSMRSGKPDLWLLKDGQQRRLTDTSSAMLAAAPLSGNALLALGFHGGEHRLFRIPESAQLSEPPLGPEVAGGSGLPLAATLDYARISVPNRTSRYDPSDTSNWRIEASAGALVGAYSVGSAGLAITDLLRDHVMMVNLAIYGSLKLTDAMAFYINQSRRPELGLGAFHTFEPRRDKTFPGEDNYYLQRMFGVAGLARYPIDRFRRVEGTLEIRGIERFAFTDYGGNLFDSWHRLNGGVEPELVASTLFGVDTTRMHMMAGPVEGYSLLSSASVGYLPVRQAAYLRLIGDAQQRFHLVGRSHLMLRAAGGVTTAGRFSPQYYLASVGNLEGLRFGDERLLGDNYYVSNARLSIPIDWLIQVPFFSGIYGIAGMDFGATFDRWGEAWDRRTLSAVLGADVGLGGLLLQLHYGKLMDVGGFNGSEPWVFNLNLKYLYF